MSTVTRSGVGSGRWARTGGRTDLAYLALCVADAARWLGWWLMQALVGWGALVCGDPRLAQGCRAELCAPRRLRHELLLRREVARGIAELEEHLGSRTAP